MELTRQQKVFTFVGTLLGLLLGALDQTVVATVWCTAAVVFPILSFRFSRGLWTAIVHLTGGVY